MRVWERLWRRRRTGQLGLLGLAVIVLGVAACSRSFDEQNAVHIITVDGVINPVTSRYIDRGIDAAEDSNAAAVVIRLDTPGGLVDSMRDIVRRINTSDVPVITWVWPSGGRAASAGTFITMAGHVAAMAPNTNIGAASPVTGGGEDLDETLERKVTNDLAAFARSLAVERGRNAEWAEDAVRDAVSATEREAVELDVVDYVARDLEALLAGAEGRTVELADERRVTLTVRDAPVVENDMTAIERFLLVLSDPNIAFILLSLGSLALVFEVIHPGLMVPGIVGVVALILAFFSLNTLPFSWAGVGLIMFGVILLVAEIFVSGFGVLAIGGVVSFILGGLFLTSSGDPEFQVSRWLIFGMTAVVAVFLLMVINTVIRTRRMPSAVGMEALVGRRVLTRSALDPEGYVFLEGERWLATSEVGPVAQGESVTITGVKGLRLTVKKAEGPPQADAAIARGEEGASAAPKAKEGT